jgi:hypothetical protein
MAPMRAPTVTAARSFQEDVEALRGEYPRIDDVVAELGEALVTGLALPHMPIDPQNLPRVYGAARDYRPLGVGGRGVFLATYHASDPDPNPMQNPYRRFTLLTITKR